MFDRDNGVAMERRTVKCGALFVLILMVFSAYCNTLSSPPFLDDFHTFIEREQVHIKDFSPASLLSLSHTPFGWGRWIPMLTFALNHRLGGSSLMIFHFTNILIHLLVLLSVFFLALQLIKLIRDKSDKETTSPFWIAFCIASLWALNPVQTSAVTYLVQRMASLEALFYVTSVALFIKGRILQRSEGTIALSASLLYFGSFLSGICSFLSKENAATLPLMILVTEIWFFQPDLLFDLLRRLKNGRRIVWFFTAICLGVALLAACFFFRQFTAGYDERHFTMLQRLLTEARVVVWYISLLFWPAPSRLSMEHDVVISTSLLSPPTTLASILLLALLFFSAIRFRRKSPVITYGIAWFFINLAIESTFLPLELVFEHRLYLPSVGFLISLAATAEWLFRLAAPGVSARDRLALLCSVVMIISSALTFATFHRNEAWENIVTIQEDAASKAPNNPRAHANLATAYFFAQQYDKGIESAGKSIELIQPRFESFSVAANAMLICLMRRGDLDEATERVEQLLKAHPKDIDAGSMPTLYTNLGEAYRRKGQLQEAFDSASNALRWAQGLGSPMPDKVRVAVLLKFILEAARETSIDLDNDGKPDPGDELPEAWIASEFFSRGDVEMAKRLVAEALIAQPDDPQSLQLSARIRQAEESNREQQPKWSFSQKYVRHPFSKFNFSMAVAFIVQEKHLPVTIMKVGEEFLDYALTLRPASADAHLLKGWYYYQRDDAAKAVAEAKRAIELDPVNGKAWLGLGFFQIKAEEKENAIASFDKALALYPGYSAKQVVLDLVASLKEGKPAGVFGPSGNAPQDEGPESAGELSNSPSS